MPLPPINYHFWMNRNPFYGDNPIPETMRTSLVHYASRPGLINDVILNMDNLLCSELVQKIKSGIENVVNNNLFENEALILRIFDLIHGWGGKMGKGPYVPFQNPVRNQTDNWCHIYQSAIRLAIQGDPNSLREFIRIPKIGESFGTKHMHFWSKYGAGQPVPIYDLRIKTLLYFTDNRFPSYQTYINDISQEAQNNNLAMEDIERALFAFSTNYFPNNNLRIKTNYSSDVDLDIAQNLERQWINLKQR
jgi:hypothetical protein